MELNNKNTHIETGKNGEKLAVDFLLKLHIEIVEVNWRNGKKEIDIIAKKNNVLLFIEVKTRRNNENSPEDAIDKNKQQLLLKAADAYCKINNYNGNIRFDTIGIKINGYSKEINYTPDAFYAFVTLNQLTD